MICKPREMISIVEKNPEVLFYLLIAAVVCFVVPYVLYNLALNDIEASKAAVIVSIEPVMATIFGFLLYQEKITIAVFMGMILVLTAITILNIGKMKGRHD